MGPHRPVDGRPSRDVLDPRVSVAAPGPRPDGAGVGGPSVGRRGGASVATCAATAAVDTAGPAGRLVVSGPDAPYSGRPPPSRRSGRDPGPGSEGPRGRAGGQAGAPGGEWTGGKQRHALTMTYNTSGLRRTTCDHYRWRQTRRRGPGRGGPRLLPAPCQSRRGSRGSGGARAGRAVREWKDVELREEAEPREQHRRSPCPPSSQSRRARARGRGRGSTSRGQGGPARTPAPAAAPAPGPRPPRSRGGAAAGGKTRPGRRRALVPPGPDVRRPGPGPGPAPPCRPGP